MYENATGSHCEGKKSHRDTYYGKGNILHRGQELEMVIDEERVMSVELKPGEASLHYGWLAHTSYPNLSDDSRIGLSLHYISPRVLQNHTDKESATLVRGKIVKIFFPPNQFVILILLRKWLLSKQRWKRSSTRCTTQSEQSKICSFVTLFWNVTIELPRQDCRTNCFLGELIIGAQPL